MPRQVSNTFLAELFSIQNIIVICSLLIAGSMATANLQADVQANTEAVDHIKVEQKDSSERIRNIELDIATIKSDSRHTKESVKQVREDLRQIKQLLQNR